MANYSMVYLPIGVPTFHRESMNSQFKLSIETLKKEFPEIELYYPESELLDISDLKKYTENLNPDLLIVQNISFANAEYMAEIHRIFPEKDLLIWTLAEPVIDGGRLRLNSLTGAFSAANYLYCQGRNNFEYVFGSADDPDTINTIKKVVKVSQLKTELRDSNLATIGQTPQGFGFGKALDSDLQRYFGMRHMSIESRELMNLANSYSESELIEYAEIAHKRMLGLDTSPKENVLGFLRLYKAYDEFIKQNKVVAFASRCWPDFFTDYGVPVCSVLGMFNDDGIAAACEADDYGAISMLIGMRLTDKAVYFGDPVSLSKEENTITFWHCGTGACSLADPNLKNITGVHPNRKIGPTMEFGSKPAAEATMFRMGRKPDGNIRVFVETGSILEKPQQFLGTSLVFQPNTKADQIINTAVKDGWEPHFAIAYSDIRAELKILANLFNFELYEF